MSETLIGVIIGGLIASITPVVSILFDNYHKKKERRIQHLKLKRDRLENIFKTAFEKLMEGASNNLYEIDMINNFAYLMPSDVFKEFEKMMIEEAKSDNLEKRREHIYQISCSMKKVLSEIQEKIDLEIG